MTNIELIKKKMETIDRLKHLLSETIFLLEEYEELDTILEKIGTDITEIKKLNVTI